MIMVLEILLRSLICFDLFVSNVDNHNVEFKSKAASHDTRKQDLNPFQRSFMRLIYRVSLVSYRMFLIPQEYFLLVSTQLTEASADTSNAHRAVQAPCGYVGNASSIHISLTKDYFHQTPSLPP